MKDAVESVERQCQDVGVGLDLHNYQCNIAEPILYRSKYRPEQVNWVVTHIMHNQAMGISPGASTEPFVSSKDSMTPIKYKEWLEERKKRQERIRQLAEDHEEARRVEYYVDCESQLPLAIRYTRRGEDPTRRSYESLRVIENIEGQHFEADAQQAILNTTLNLTQHAGAYIRGISIDQFWDTTRVSYSIQY